MRRWTPTPARPTDRGFTLVELLVVLVILVALSTIAVTIALMQSHKAYAASADANLASAGRIAILLHSHGDLDEFLAPYPDGVVPAGTALVTPEPIVAHVTLPFAVRITPDPTGVCVVTDAPINGTYHGYDTRTGTVRAATPETVCAPITAP